MALTFCSHEGKWEDLLCLFSFLSKLDHTEMENFLTVSNITNEIWLFWDQRNERTIEKNYKSFIYVFFWAESGKHCMWSKNSLPLEVWAAMGG